ncbi:MAG: hypothetical protein CVU59_02740 [Deltaproteobacteria bacterium HGW-Deltaproteobacteria-17]|nr:MAG: hypothetical protein CVU59_02740 [Deltaproteobacteria bacterium HGW-Deltaproteobacteria-17]
MARQEMIDALVGTTIGNYIIQRKLGSGAMGTVYLGEHPEIGKRVAIKILAGHLTEDRSMVERFQIEARAIGLLEHPGIIEMFDFGVLPDGRSYYTMEYLQGETLSARMKRGGMTVAELYAIVEQVCDALYVVHQNGIIHRDMKPSNVFLARKGMRTVVKILDFGIAKIQDSIRHDGEMLTSTGAVLGTPVFMSPEQALGQNDRISYLSDIYSFGVILYKILTGRFPIDGTNIPEVVTWHVLNDAIELRTVNPQIPESLARVVMNCLRKEPSERFQSTSHLWDAFSAACGGLDFNWIIPVVTGREGTMAAPLPGGLSASGAHPSLSPAQESQSGSNSFYPPPPPQGVNPVVYQTYPGLPAEPASSSVIGGGSFVGERKSGSGRARALGVIVVLILAGAVAAWYFTRDTDTSGGGKPAPVPVATPDPEPKPEPRPVVSKPVEPEKKKIRVQVETVPASAMVTVRIGDQEKPAATGPLDFEVEPGTVVHLVAVAKGFLPADKKWTVDAAAGPQQVSLKLEPEPTPEPVAPRPRPPVDTDVTPPVMKVVPVPTMKGPTNEKIGNSLL